MGPHAGESERMIFTRKINDINNTGKTFWLVKSYRANPIMIQRLCSGAKSENVTPYCLFIEASSEGGAMPTKTASVAKSYSENNKEWQDVSNELSPITGKIDRHAYALIFDQIKFIDGQINLWEYADYINPDLPLVISRGASTLCAIKSDMSNHSKKIKSNLRKVIAFGRFCEPYGVFLK